jgi:beta-glucosidase-like glycosyl hydrolase
VGLPFVEHSKERLQNVELVPFKKAIEAKVASIMTGHLVVTAYDDKPASLSPHITTELLRNDLGFEGIIITDDLLMKAVAEEGAALKAFNAGADLILVPVDLISSIEEVRKSADPKEVDRRVRRLEAARIQLN